MTHPRIPVQSVCQRSRDPRSANAGRFRGSGRHSTGAMCDATCRIPRTALRSLFMSQEPDKPYEYGARAVAPMNDPGWRLGSGRGSAYVALFLGALALLGVLCFRFPEYLTTPDLRELYDVDLLRTILRASLTVALFCGVVSIALSRRHLRTASIGLLATGLAIVLGGYHVQGREVHGGPAFLGVDWFVLDLLGSAFLFVMIETLFPKYPAQVTFRPAWKLDLAYFAINHFLIGIMLLAANGFAPHVFGWAVNDSVRSWIRALPLPIEVIVLMLAADFVQYWVHRAFHEVPALWRIHAVHHSTEYMDWLAGSRTHFAQELVDRAFVMVPLYLLGPSTAALNIYVVVAAFQAVFVHANVSWRFGPLRYVLVTPQFHHWHHSKDKPAIDTNYAVHTPLWDLLFRSFHLPGDHWPKEYGTVHTLPIGFVGQFVYPFAREEKEAR
jgi:sterol desaturase/sphingolipid hydroxylase (fatty acid hydroxylase superfamily)